MTVRGRYLLPVVLVFSLVAALIGAATASAADPVANPGSNRQATVFGGSIKVNTRLDLDAGTITPPPQLQNVTVAANGNLSGAAGAFAFPPISYMADGNTVFITIRNSAPLTGNINPVTGSVVIDTTLDVQITGEHMGDNCHIRPIPFHATGTDYDEYSGEFTIVDNTLSIPTAGGCPNIVGIDVNTKLNETLGLPSPSGANQVRLKLRFRTNAPHSSTWVDPAGPGNIDPVIVNDSLTPNSLGSIETTSWLESSSISDGGISGRSGNTVVISLLVKHNPGLKVTGLRVDDDWDAINSSAVKDIKTAGLDVQQPSMTGGFNYSRVTLRYQAPRTGMGLNCPVWAWDPNLLSRQAEIHVLAHLSDGTETASSTSNIGLSRESCPGSWNDPPMIYDQSQDKTTAVPGEPVTFQFRGDDYDDEGIPDNQFAGYRWRWRNLDTGAVEYGNQVCYNPGDNILRTLSANAPDRGRWAMEARLYTQSCDNAGIQKFWYRIGAVDVNSPAYGSGVRSPSVKLDVPLRPEVSGDLPVKVDKPTLVDGLDAAAGGRVQALQWDLDGDYHTGIGGFEVVRLGDSHTGMASGQNRILLETAGMEPGLHLIRVRAGDNGALGAADNVRRTNLGLKFFLVNTPPTAEDLTVATDFETPVPVSLVADDTNVDGGANLGDAGDFRSFVHDPLRWSLSDPPSHGYLAGEWPDRVYHPDDGFSGTDSFQYTVDDGFGGTATATVTVTVRPGSSDPDPGGPGGSGSDRLSVSFPEGRINLKEEAGPGTSGIKVVDSSVPDPPVTFTTDTWNSGTGEINAPPDALQFPEKSIRMDITDPIPLNLDVRIKFGALGRITGSYNSSSGALGLNFNAHALISVKTTAGLEVLTCDVTPIPIAFSSGGADLVDPGEPGVRPAKTWRASPFAPPSRAGAVTSLWSSLPASNPVREPLAPTASCGGTLDGLLGGTGGLWLGGKVKLGGSGSADPTGTVAVFDGKRLHIRLKCGPQYRPACRSKAVPVTTRDRVKRVRRHGRVMRRVVRGRAMARPVKRKIRAGRWVRVTFLVKPKYRARVRAMTKKKSKQLFVRQQIRSKKIGRKKFPGKKPRIAWHRYRVRLAG